MILSPSERFKKRVFCISSYLLSRSRRILIPFFNSILPPRCLLCDTMTLPHAAETRSHNADLCITCWPTLLRLDCNICTRCGHPFTTQMPEGTCCPSCLADPPAYDRARAALVYNKSSRTLILRFKHADATHAAPALAAMMCQAGQDLLRDADLIVPVPLHWHRLWKRQYNQSALLAKFISKATGVPCDLSSLKRKRQTRPQGGLGRRARKRNVQGAFLIKEPTMFKGKRIILIDDVLTTGATVQACARCLYAAGAYSVDVLTLARVNAIENKDIDYEASGNIHN